MVSVCPDRCMLGHKLQTVLVSGDDGAVPAGFFTGGGNGAKDIVRLIARELIAADSHGVQGFLQQRHLLCQLLRHGVARCLIIGVGQMAEGRLFAVKADAERLRLLLLQQPLQNGKKAVDRVGGRAVRRVERAYTIKSAVDDAVAVQNHTFHSLTSSAAIRRAGG